MGLAEGAGGSLLQVTRSWVLKPKRSGQAARRGGGRCRVQVSVRHPGPSAPDHSSIYPWHRVPSAGLGIRTLPSGMRCVASTASSCYSQQEGSAVTTNAESVKTEPSRLREAQG